MKCNKTEIETILNQKIKKVKEITHGFDQFIYILTTENTTTYVLKIPKKIKILYSEKN